ncbi:hypothetical protein [Hyphomicrobium sp. D-2]|uniref:hypothetical protein n=1 Tax=Hyphomicrobium sp. D-2 TaxID=3041621 RepID=UPI0024537EFB|nr:hypothetical protein [Hyphomicrobium sp. D-2]MDH4982469.1 hypothetical protein [Hyphomicrobium sp. D-2]
MADALPELLVEEAFAMSNLVDLDAERQRRNHTQCKEQHEPEMWCCDCGCITFYQWSTGAIQCAACKVVQNGLDAPSLPRR